MDDAERNLIDIHVYQRVVRGRFQTVTIRRLGPLQHLRETVAELVNTWRCTDPEVAELLDITVNQACRLRRQMRLPSPIPRGWKSGYRPIPKPVLEHRARNGGQAGHMNVHANGPRPAVPTRNDGPRGAP